MNKISIEEAKNLIYGSDAKYVAQEQISIYYDNFSGLLDIDPYYTNECLVVKSNMVWHIHALNEKSDIISAIQTVKKLMSVDYEKLMVFTWNYIPDELIDKNGSVKFARGYMTYNDTSVRELTLEDAEKIEKCCSFDAEDNNIGRDLSEEFLLNYRTFIKDSKIVNLGLFEHDTLVGFAQSFLEEDLKLSTINIFVNRKYRNKGYAKRLLFSICATEKDVIYCYSCVKSNIASSNTAKACGFEFKGAYLLIQ
ncbi:MAG: GNAT family N-acetyltransferase [Clostridia bacterium]|nr:GNAT family N-acetyltransferase [Clostridia bacterium]